MAPGPWVDRLDPAGVVELVRLALDRARQLGCLRDVADAIDSTLKASRTPTEDLALIPTEVVGCPRCGGG